MKKKKRKLDLSLTPDKEVKEIEKVNTKEEKKIKNNSTVMNNMANNEPKPVDEASKGRTLEAKEPNEKKKLSYEELENIARQLGSQCEQLYSKYKELDLSNFFKRLDYLFKVVENKHSLAPDFVEKCAKEIVEMMTPPEEPKKSK